MSQRLLWSFLFIVSSSSILTSKLSCRSKLLTKNALWSALTKPYRWVLFSNLSHQCNMHAESYRLDVYTTLDYLLRSLRRHDGARNVNVKKAKGWISKTTTLYVHRDFFKHFFVVSSLKDVNKRLNLDMVFLSETFAAVAVLGYLINSLLSGCRRRVQATKWDTVEWRLLHLLLPIMFVVQDETIPKAKEKWKKYLTPTTTNNNVPWVYKAPLRLLHFPWRFFPGKAQ